MGNNDFVETGTGGRFTKRRSVTVHFGACTVPVLRLNTEQNVERDHVLSLLSSNVTNLAVANKA